MISPLGDVINITNLIISEKYSLIDKSKFIFEIKNNKPYIVNTNDEKAIRESVIKWLNENYPNQSFEILKSLYAKSKYITTKMGIIKPYDVYSIEITPNKNIGKIVINFCFSEL